MTIIDTLITGMQPILTNDFFRKFYYNEHPKRQNIYKAASTVGCSRFTMGHAGIASDNRWRLWSMLSAVKPNGGLIVCFLVVNANHLIN